MCFDGFKSYILGWYSSKTVVVDPSTSGPWLGTLSAFVDYNSSVAEIVLIKVGTSHLLYNAKKGINAGTKEKANLVTVTEGTEASKQSWNIGGLGAGQQITVGKVAIEVCTVGTTQGTGYAEVSIFTTSQESLC
jgi:hypothetical protein